MGGGGGQSAFGTKAGDLFTKITIGLAAFWILLCIVALRVLSSSSSKFTGADDGTSAPATPAGTTAPSGEQGDRRETSRSRQSRAATSTTAAAASPSGNDAGHSDNARSPGDSEIQRSAQLRPESNFDYRLSRRRRTFLSARWPRRCPCVQRSRHLLLSMTGFGEARRQEDGLSIAVEVRTINSRYFKIAIRTGEGHAALEPQIEGLVRERIKRGTVQVNLRVDRPASPEAYRINTPALLAYWQQLNELPSQWNLPRPTALGNAAGACPAS